MITAVLQDIRPHEALLTLRRRRDLTLAEASVLIGISANHLSRVEKGDVLPGRDLAVAIESEFGIPVAAWSEAKAAVPEAATA